MKEICKKILVLVMCAALMSALLTSCGDDPDVPDVNDDPAAYLQTALNNTMAELSSRYSASPISAISSSISGPVSSLGFDLDISANGETASLGGTLYSDTENNQYLLDGNIGAGGVELGAQFYYQPEFIGAACEFLLGSDAFYGFRPYGLVEQATGSVFDASTGSQFGFDTSVLQEMDDLIDSFRNTSGLSIQETIDEIKALNDEFTAQLDITVEKQPVSFAGDEQDGYKLTAVYTAEEVAQLMGDMMGVIKETGFFSAAFEFSALSGSGTTEADFDAQIDAMIAELSASEEEITLSYYICEEKVISMEMSTSQSPDDTVTVDYYGNDGSTVTMGATSLSTPILVSHVDTSSGYSHTATVNGSYSIGEVSGSVMALENTWDRDSGAFSFSLDVDDGSYSSASLSLSGNLTVSDGDGFTLENGILSADDGYNATSIDISMVGAVEESFPAPAETVNIFELSEDELYNLMANLYYMFG